LLGKVGRQRLDLPPDRRTLRLAGHALFGLFGRKIPDYRVLCALPHLTSSSLPSHTAPYAPPRSLTTEHDAYGGPRSRPRTKRPSGSGLHKSANAGHRASRRLRGVSGIGDSGMH
jgi:hypothetical protein